MMTIAVMGRDEMDKQTAIDLLDNLLGMVEDNHDSDYDTAIKMGIDAIKEKIQLSKEDATKGTTFDCISRQAAIGAAIDAADDWDGGYNLSRADMIEKAINNLPSVQPQRWIPVTERLPEHSGFYIVTAIVTDDGGKLVGLRWFSQEHGWKFGKNPLAWMPLPEPWRGQNETN